MHLLLYLQQVNITSRLHQAPTLSSLNNLMALHSQAQMRAIETGLPIARSANTGISAMIDPFGRIVASAAMNTSAVIDAPIAEKRETVYAAASEAFTIALLFVLFLMAGMSLLTSRKA